MAVEESDREDLFRDAKMMPIRGKLQIDENTIVIGFRSDGQLSLYCDADPVFQFNVLKELRRVFYKGVRYTAERGSLVQLTRNSKGGKVTFDRESLSAETETEIMSALTVLLNRISQSPSADWKSAGENDQFVQQVDQWMQEKSPDHAIADSPNAS